MNIRLTEQQQQVLDGEKEAAPRVIDPRTNTAYVLIPEADYVAVREILEDERQQQALRIVALQNAAGRMDESP